MMPSRPLFMRSQGDGRQVLGQYEFQDLRVAVLELGEQLGARDVDVAASTLRTAAPRADRTTSMPTFSKKPFVGEDGPRASRCAPTPRLLARSDTSRFFSSLLVTATSTGRSPIRSDCEQVEVRAVAVGGRGPPGAFGDLLAALSGRPR